MTTRGERRMAVTVDDLQKRLRDAHARIGHEGRFALTIDQSREADFYIVHWVRPSEYSLEDCRVVGSGTLDDCLAALDRYAELYRSRVTVAAE